MIAKRLDITGRVQDVRFRKTTKEKAEELGIYGWVRNCKKREDMVKIYALGEEDALLKFIDWCHTGPSNALIDSVEISHTEAKKYESFEITE